MAENNNVTTGTEQQGQNGQQQNGSQEGMQYVGKMFTQEEVNQIVQARLGRMKDNSAAAADQREQTLNERELRLDAREKLADSGISKDWLPLVNCSSKEEMDKSIKLISSLIGQQQHKATVYRVIAQPPKRTGKLENFPNGDPDIRAAMGLKG